jgi:hypothetical protein
VARSCVLGHEPPLAAVDSVGLPLWHRARAYTPAQVTEFSLQELRFSVSKRTGATASVRPYATCACFRREGALSPLRLISPEILPPRSISNSP